MKSKTKRKAKRYIVLVGGGLFIDTFYLEYDALCEVGENEQVYYLVDGDDLIEVCLYNVAVQYCDGYGLIKELRSATVNLGKILYESDKLETLAKRIESSGAGEVEYLGEEITIKLNGIPMKYGFTRDRELGWIITSTTLS